MTGLSHEPKLISQVYLILENYNSRRPIQFLPQKQCFTRKRQGNLSERKLFLEREKKRENRKINSKYNEKLWKLVCNEDEATLVYIGDEKSEKEEICGSF